jgi:hypothetical protein
VAVARWAAALMRMVRRLAAPIRIRPYLSAASFLDLQARQQRRYAARQADLARREQAMQSSRELLRACLRTDQLVQFDRAGWFMVSGRMYDYRINYGRTANVELMARDGSYLRRLCFYPVARGGRDLPVFDVMLAQKLMLEADESGALTIAVGHP